MPTSKKLSHLELLPNPLKLNVLGFLAPRDKKVASAISNDIKKIADTLSFGPFYMVGKPIHIGNTSSGFLSKFIINPRQSVSADEITRSFPKDGSVELFDTIETAELYAKSLRRRRQMGNKHVNVPWPVDQPAVFTVSLLQKPPQMESRLFTIKSLDPSKNMHAFVPVKSFRADVSDIVPIKGKLEVDFYDDGQIKHYGTVNGVINEDKNEQTRKCTVS